MKKNSILKVSLLTILCVTIFTWIFKTANYDGTGLTIGDKSELGLFPLLSYIPEVVRYFTYVPLYILSVGIFYGVMYKIPAYRDLLDVIVKKFEGKENIFLIATMCIIALIVSITGLSLGIMFIFPFVISLVLLMGYNKLVAASVSVGSTMVGLMGVTLGTSATQYINLVLGTQYTDEMITKVIILVLGLIILCFNVVSYAKKTKNSTDKVLDYVPEEKKEPKKEEVKEVKEVKVEKEEKKASNKNAKKKASKSKSTKTKANDNSSKSVKVVKNGKKSMIWPMIIMLDLVLLLIVVGTFDWHTIFKATWPSEALTAAREFSVGGFLIFDKLIFGSSFGSFGYWTTNVELPAIMLLAPLVIGFVYGLSFDKILEGITDGVKKAVKPAIYMTLIYLVLVIVAYHPFQLNFIKPLLTATKGLNIITMSLIAFIASLFNIESLYVAQFTLPYITSYITDAKLYPIIAVIYQSIYALTMLIAPTSIILLGTLSYLDVSYVQWIKHIWKLLLELLLLLIVIFLVLILI